MPTAPPLINFESCMATGATFFGVAVEACDLKLADGRRLHLEFPILLEVAASDEDTVVESPATRVAEVATEILEVLGRFKPGEWMSQAGVALEIGDDARPDGGSFKRAVAKLKAATPSKIETHPKKGLRLAVDGQST